VQGIRPRTRPFSRTKEERKSRALYDKIRESSAPMDIEPLDSEQATEKG
jgi:hypothetical protein